MIGFKVIYNHGSDMTGWVMWIVEYIKGIWAFPPPDHGPLCVFDTYENAKAFTQNSKSWQTRIWQCEYEPSESKIVWNDIGDMKDIFPEGTILADRVKLLEELT